MTAAFEEFGRDVEVLYCGFYIVSIDFQQADKLAFRSLLALPSALISYI
jgi:hypothetical protein